MTSSEHYREAERLITQMPAADLPHEDIAMLTRAAQVHATLAVAAGTDDAAERYRQRAEAAAVDAQRHKDRADKAESAAAEHGWVRVHNHYTEAGAAQRVHVAAVLETMHREYGTWDDMASAALTALLNPDTKETTR